MAGAGARDPVFGNSGTDRAGERADPGRGADGGVSPAGRAVERVGRAVLEGTRRDKCAVWNLGYATVFRRLPWLAGLFRADGSLQDWFQHVNEERVAERPAREFEYQCRAWRYIKCSAREPCQEKEEGNVEVVKKWWWGREKQGQFFMRLCLSRKR